MMLMGFKPQPLPAIVFWAIAGIHATAAELNSAMERDPLFAPQDVVHSAPEGLIPLWLDALDRADVETEVVCRVAQGLVRCHRLGIAVDSRAVEKLAQQLDRKDIALAGRLAVARALVELGAREHAERLAAEARGGGRDMAEIVEPALAVWGDRSLSREWLARLEDPHTPGRALRLAIEAVGSLGDAAARTPLLQIVTDASRPVSLRVAAAKSTAQVTASGLEPEAERLLAGSSTDPHAALLAVHLLARHTGARAEQLLTTLSENDNSAVAAAAVARLIDADMPLPQPKLKGLLRSSDPTLRLLGVRAVRRDPNAAGIALLSDVLDDHHLDVRRAAAEALIEFARVADRREPVCRQVASLLDDDFPRRTEQALLILAELDFEEAASRIVQLLDSSEPTVSIAAAWSLERLAAAGTEEPIYNRLVLEAQRSTELAQKLMSQNSGEASGAEQPDLTPNYSRAEHLILALGQLRFERSADFLQRFIAKPNWQPGDPPLVELDKQPRVRAAAIWALGKIYADQGSEAPGELVDALIGRLADATPIPREEPIVRRMAAVSMGRVKATVALPQLRQFFDPATDHDELRRASGWALEQITSLPSEQGGPRTIRHVDWFLVPLDR
jgi:HEAT repeat protein